jgi:hypothetical protein
MLGKFGIILNYWSPKIQILLSNFEIHDESKIQTLRTRF